MKKVFALICCVATMLLSVAYAVTPLRHRYEWFALMEPSDKFDHAAFLTGLEKFHDAYPDLMNDDYYNALYVLGQEASLIESDLEYVDDPFEGTTSIWYPGVKQIDENHHFVVYTQDVYPMFTASIVMDDWINIQKFIMACGDERVSTSNEDSQFEYDSEGNRVELLSGGIGFATGIDDLSKVATVAIRFYGSKDTDYVDYTMTEDEVAAFKATIRLQQIRTEIRETLQEWCETIDDLPLAEEHE